MTPEQAERFAAAVRELAASCDTASASTGDYARAVARLASLIDETGAKPEDFKTLKLRQAKGRSDPVEPKRVPVGPNRRLIDLDPDERPRAEKRAEAKAKRAEANNLAFDPKRMAINTEEASIVRQAPEPSPYLREEDLADAANRFRRAYPSVREEWHRQEAARLLREAEQQFEEEWGIARAEARRFLSEPTPDPNSPGQREQRQHEEFLREMRAEEETMRYAARTRAARSAQTIIPRENTRETTPRSPIETLVDRLLSRNEPSKR